MAGIISRKIFVFFVPTVFLAFLSAYWLHRKRKLKGKLDPLAAPVTSSHCDFNSSQNDDLLLSQHNHHPSVESCKEKTDESLTESVNMNHEDDDDDTSKSELVFSLPRGLSPPDGECNVGTGSKEDTDDVSSSHDAFCENENVHLNSEKKDDSSSLIEQLVSDEGSRDDDQAEVRPCGDDSHSCEEMLVKQQTTSLTECSEGTVAGGIKEVSYKSEMEHVDITSSGNDQSENTVPNTTVQCNKGSCTDTAATDFAETNNQSAAEDSLPNESEKSSPSVSGSPLSSGHGSCTNNNSNNNNNDMSDSEVFSSVGTSSISLNELMSVSPVESTKEHSLNFHSDDDAFNDSGKGSTVNLDPVSSCSYVSELDESTSLKDHEGSHRSGGDFTFSSSSSCATPAAVETDSLDNRLYSKDTSGQASTSQLNSMPGTQIEYQEPNANKITGAVMTDPKLLGGPSSPYVYEFELPQELCGRLIGRHGKHVNFIKERTNASVYIRRHPFNHGLKLAVIEGTRCEVNNALELIRKKFPPSLFPNLTLAQTNAAVGALGVAVPESLQLHLPERTSCDVILSSMVNAGHFFLQQPTHPTYASLSALDQCMMACYSQGDTPHLPSVIEAGVICAASVMGGWYRAQVVFVYESGEDCEVKFVDYGGYSQVPASSLRQIRSDFMALPFQASECYLANVQPINELGWTPEASATFEELAQGQILQAVVVDYHEDGNPYVHLYRVQGVTSTFINQELVNRGMAKWVEHR